MRSEESSKSIALSKTELLKFQKALNPDYNSLKILDFKNDGKVVENVQDDGQGGDAAADKTTTEQDELASQRQEATSDTQTDNDSKTDVKQTKQDSDLAVEDRPPSSQNDE